MGFVALLALIVMLPGFFTLPPVDRDESRFSQATKQMVATGDFIDIRNGDKPRYKKPVGIYWLQSIPAAIAGEEHAREIWVYRLTSLGAAIGASLVTYAIALTLAGPKAALLAGSLMAVSLVLGAEARQAKTDAALLLSILLSQLVLARLWMRGESAIRGAWIWLFWISLGASVLIKGPIGLMVVGTTIAGLSLLTRDLRWVAPLRFKGGSLVFLALVLPWYIAITLKTGQEFWDESLGRDMLGKVATGQENHGAPAGYYLATLWLTFWPAAFLLPYGFAYAWRERANRAVWFCVAWIVPTWIVFEIAVTKLPHYTLPVFPALAVLTAAGWIARNDQPQGRSMAVVNVVLLTLGGALVVLPLAASIYIDQGPTIWWLIGMVTFFAGVALIWPALRQARSFAPIVGMAVIGFGVATAFWAHLAREDFLWTGKQLAAIEATTPLCDGGRVIATGYTEPSLRLQSRGNPLFTSPDAAAEAVKALPCSLVYVEARRLETFAAALGDTALPEPIATVQGMNLGNGREVSVSAYLFEKSP